MKLNVYLFNTDQGSPEKSELFIGAPREKQNYVLKMRSDGELECDTVVIDFGSSGLDEATVHAIAPAGASADEWRATSQNKVLTLKSTSAGKLPLEIFLRIDVPSTVAEGEHLISISAGGLWARLCTYLSRWPVPRDLGECAVMTFSVEGGHNEMIYVTRDGEVPRDNTIRITLANESPVDMLQAQPQGGAEFFAFFEYGSGGGKLAPVEPPAGTATAPDPTFFADAIRSAVDSDSCDWVVSTHQIEGGGGKPVKYVDKDLPDGWGEPALYWRWKPGDPGDVVLPPKGIVNFLLRNIRIRAIPETKQGQTMLFVGWRHFKGINEGFQSFVLEKVLGPGLTMFALDPPVPDLTNGERPAALYFNAVDTGVPLMSLLLTRSSAPGFLASLPLTANGKQPLSLSMSGAETLTITAEDKEGKTSEHVLRVATVRQASVNAHIGPGSVKLAADGKHVVIATELPTRQDKSSCDSVHRIDWDAPGKPVLLFDLNDKSPRSFLNADIKLNGFAASDGLDAIWVALSGGVTSAREGDYEWQAGGGRALCPVDPRNPSAVGAAFTYFGDYPSPDSHSPMSPELVLADSAPDWKGLYWSDHTLCALPVKFFPIDWAMHDKLQGMAERIALLNDFTRKSKPDARDTATWRDLAAGKMLLGLCGTPPTSVGIFRPNDRKLDTPIPLTHPGAQALAATPDSGRAYVGYSGRKAIDVFDMARRTCTQSIETATAVKLLAVSADGARLFAYSEEDQTITVYVDHKPWMKIPAKGVACMSASADGKRLAVTQAPDALMLYDLP